MKSDPQKELSERFEALERKVDVAVELIGRLKAENRGLAARLAEEGRLRKRAAERIEALLDRIELLT